MPDTVPLHDLHGRILRDTFGSLTCEGDGLLLFGILHSYQIVLSGPVLSDCRCEAGTRMAADTQRGCAQAVAEMYTGELAEPMYWYRRWADWGSYSRLESVTRSERERMRGMMRHMQSHPFLLGFAYEDDGYDPAEYFEVDES